MSGKRADGEDEGEEVGEVDEVDVDVEAVEARGDETQRGLAEDFKSRCAKKNLKVFN